MSPASIAKQSCNSARFMTASRRSKAADLLGRERDGGFLVTLLDVETHVAHFEISVEP